MAGSSNSSWASTAITILPSRRLFSRLAHCSWPRPSLPILSQKEEAGCLFAPLFSARLSDPETETPSPDDKGTYAEPLIQQSALLVERDWGFRIEIIAVEMPALLRRTTTKSAWSRDSVVA